MRFSVPQEARAVSKTTQKFIKTVEVCVKLTMSINKNLNKPRNRQSKCFYFTNYLTT